MLYLKTRAACRDYRPTINVADLWKFPLAGERRRGNVLWVTNSIVIAVPIWSFGSA